MLFSECCAKPRKLAVRAQHTDTCSTVQKRHTYSHTHTTHNTCQFYVKRVLGPGTKLIPSILSWSQQKRLEDDVLNNLITPNKKDAASFKKKKKGQKKKGSPTYTQKGFFEKKKLLPLHNKIQNNYDRLHELLEKKTPQELLHFTTLVS